MSRNSASLDVQVGGIVESASRPQAQASPSLFVIPNTPPLESQFPKMKVRDYVEEHSSHHLRPPSQHDRSLHEPSLSNGQTNILGALSIGAPLIASVVSSCTSGICADLTAVLGADPLTRPVRASVIIALLWSALITSLGATMTAVAGLAMSAGYHDSHVGVTKKIVRFVRQWHSKHRTRTSFSEVRDHEMRPPSPALSAITDTHKDQHAAASFRAAVVSARLLGLSVALLAVALAVYLFLLYPLSVGATTLGVGILTTAVAAAPLLPIIWPSSS
ncbi:hypothetical protein BDN70DRAFT_874142 [Pholiota conissans]|uniref:Uncharacterized protein n=1 Tax=Pholiota conissans TaxID=109636 RepID=A0A9P5ZA84_9AGAR|nr:hypothetical protein BDN70DRAFT_874142 [Pholiota conissans]